MAFKVPVSVLVVIHSPELDVLLLERADRPGFWQSVTGSQDGGESLRETAIREVAEETGIDALGHRLADWELRNVYEIYPQWRGRYAPGVTHNTEHVFGLTVPRDISVRLSPREHLRHAWVPLDEAVGKVFSWSNADALRLLPEKLAAAGRPC
jgi:dATP pyrophosphohydrolase